MFWRIIEIDFSISLSSYYKSRLSQSTNKTNIKRNYPKKRVCEVFCSVVPPNTAHLFVFSGQYISIIPGGIQFTFRMMSLKIAPSAASGQIWGSVGNHQWSYLNCLTLGFASDPQQAKVLPSDFQNTVKEETSVPFGWEAEEGIPGFQIWTSALCKGMKVTCRERQRHGKKTFWSLVSGVFGGLIHNGPQ